MNSRIKLLKLFPLFDWGSAKFHIAQKAGSTQPIDVFTRSFDEWQNKWNGAYHSNHCWSRPYIFSLIELPKQPNRWLFGGIFEVLSHEKRIEAGKEQSFYRVALHSDGEELIGRLVVEWEKDARGKGRMPDRILENMDIAEIYPKPYSGIDFPGYEDINLPYSELEQIWADTKEDWYAALSHCQGIYLITDTGTAKRYVGSAYGEDGIWSRWSSYFRTGGHGNNKLLKELLSEVRDVEDYARKNMQMCLLEQIPNRATEEYVLQRENFWKEALYTRGKYGLNAN